MNGKAKKIIGIVVDVIIVLVIILAAVVSITSFTEKASGGVPSIFGNTAFSIKTDSMSPTIRKGDYILGKECADSTALKKGDIITFFTYDANNVRFVNTHRIVEVLNTGTMLYYRTQGDNVETPDDALVAPGDVISLWAEDGEKGVRIPALGAVIEFLGTKMGFFIFIILPILLFTMWQVYKLIKVVMYNQKVEILEENKQDEEEIKRKAIEEYLAKQNEQGEQDSDTDK